MKIICPCCGKEFDLDDNSAAQLIVQLRDKLFNQEVEKRVENALENQRKIYKEHLKSSLLEEQNKAQQEKITLEKKLEQEKNNLIAKYQSSLREIQEELDYYKNFKSRSNIKLIGESLEQHCLAEFNKIRALFTNPVVFDKDNEVIEGTKADFIYREFDNNGVEIISIIFEMKNESDISATKHKNEDFLSKLDKDRTKKNCEYAVLVSLLEIDNEFYNTGITIAHNYVKMFVIRPQFFLPLIMILRNSALNSLATKQALIEQQNRTLDITNFENKLQEFKEKIAKNYETAISKFAKAIEEIDKTIDHLQKVKENLLASEKQFRLANDKADELTIKKLTYKNPTMKDAFDDLKNK